MRVCQNLWLSIAAVYARTLATVARLGVVHVLAHCEHIAALASHVRELSHSSRPCCFRGSVPSPLIEKQADGQALFHRLGLFVRFAYLAGIIAAAFQRSDLKRKVR